jgi:hypothetical protein
MEDYGSGLVFLLIITYWIPTAVAMARRVSTANSIFILNFFLGWTLIGWVIALMMAVAPKKIPVES